MTLPDPDDRQAMPNNLKPEPARRWTPAGIPQPDEPPRMPPPQLASMPSPDKEPVPIPPRNRAVTTARPDIMRSATSRGSVMTAALLLHMLAPVPAMAQTPERNPNSSSSAPCQIRPDDQAGSNDTRGIDRRAQGSKAPQPQLERCNGVLTPPKSGDEEIEKLAPDTGTTPVLPPGAVPKPSPE